MMRLPNGWSVVSVALALAGTSCGGGEGEPSTCTPGQQITCPCLGEGQGVQVCGADGTYGACTCPTGMGGGGSGGVGGSGGGTGGGMGGSTMLCAPGSTQGCYTGPAGTEGVGSCAGGTHECASDGASWGPCLGEVVPATDLCATPADEDCDGATLACGAPVFAEAALGVNLRGIAVDPNNGDVVVAGRGDYGPTVFGSFSFSAQGFPVIAKYSAAGAATAYTEVTVASAWDSNINAVAVDGNGDIIVVGEFSEPITFGSTTLMPYGLGDSTFVAKYTSALVPVWASAHGGNHTTQPTAVAVDSANNIYVTGHFGQNALIGATMFTSLQVFDGYLVKLAPNGAPQWSRQYGGVDADNPEHLAIDSADNVVLTGSFEDDIAFGSTTLTTPGNTKAIFLAKVSPAGTAMWAHSFGDAAGDQEGRGVAVGPADSIALAATFGGTVDFGGGALGAGTTFSNAAFALFDATGNHQWSFAMGSAPTAHIRGLRAGFDANGEIYVAGTVQETASVSVPSVPAVAGPGGFGTSLVVGKVASTGNGLWVKVYGNPQPQGTTDAATTPAGDFAFTGRLTGVVDFDGDAIAGGQNASSFTVVLGP